MIIYVLLSIILLFFLLFLIPHKINLSINYSYMDGVQDVKNKNHMDIKLFGILPIIRIKVFKRILDFFEGKDIHSVAKIVNEKIEKKRQRLITI